MSLAQRAVRGAVFVLFSSYANMGLGVVYGILLARLLTPEHFGVFAGAMFFASLFDVRGKLGLDYAFIHKQPTTPELLSTHFGLQVCAALITLLVSGFAALILAQFNYHPAIAILIVALAGAWLLEACGTTARTALEKELSFGRSTGVITGALTVSYLAALLVAWLGGTYWALWAQLLVNATLSTVGFWWAYRRFGTPAEFTWRLDPTLVHWMLRFGAIMTVASIATVVLLQFDNFLVLTLVGTTAAGYYVQAYKIAQWPTGLVTHIVSRVSAPTYSKLQNDLPRLSKAFELNLWLILTVSLPLALGIFAAAPDFLRLLYGEMWIPATTPLRFLIAYAVLRPLLDDTGALLIAIGRPERVTRVMLKQAIILIIVATPLTLVFGSIGTAIGVGIAFAIGISLMYNYIVRLLNINLWRLFLSAGIALVMAFLLYGVIAPYLNDLPWLWVRVAIKGSGIAVIFLSIVSVLQYKELLIRISFVWELLHPTK